jgi:hypothetical protein
MKLLEVFVLSSACSKTTGRLAWLVRPNAFALDSSFELLNFKLLSREEAFGNARPDHKQIEVEFPTL